jgi:hypothetical protein
MIRQYLRRLYRLAIPLLTGRKQFKLFLNSTLGDINLRMLSIASVADYFTAFVRPVVVTAPFGKSMLVLAPHQDDNSLILLYRRGNYTHAFHDQKKVKIEVFPGHALQAIQASPDVPIRRSI